jgi:hypothetical protein
MKKIIFFSMFMLVALPLLQAQVCGNWYKVPESVYPDSATLAANRLENNVLKIPHGFPADTLTIDGTIDPFWQAVELMPVERFHDSLRLTPDPGYGAYARMMYDDNWLYVLVVVYGDDSVDTEGATNRMDRVELMFQNTFGGREDGTYNHCDSADWRNWYWKEDGDRKWAMPVNMSNRLQWLNTDVSDDCGSNLGDCAEEEMSDWATLAANDTVQYGVNIINDTVIYEMAYHLHNFCKYDTNTPADSGHYFGFDISIRDQDGDDTITTHLNYNDLGSNAWAYTVAAGKMMFGPYIGLLTTFTIKESATSNPIANAEVSIPGYGTKTTDASGNVTFLVDSVAQYNYTVSHPNYFDSTGSVFVQSDTTLNLSLETVYQVTFTITDVETGDSIENAKIYLEHYDTLKTNAQGQVTFIDVFVEDSLHYTVSADTYFSTQGYVDVVDQNVFLNDTLTPLPVISTNGSLVGFESYADSASQIQSYSVSGEHLLDDLILKVSGEFEISTNFMMEYVDSVSLSPTSGFVGPETIYVRMKTISNTGVYAGNILHYSASAENQNLPLSGQVIPAPEIIVNEALTEFNTEEGTASASQSYTVAGYNLIDTITISASDKMEISTDDVNYGSSVQLIPVNDTVSGTDIYVRVKSGAGTGSLDEQIEHMSDDANPVTINITGFVSILDVMNELNYEDNILLYPNAAEETITIRNDMADVFTIEILNLEGKLFKTIHADQNEIQIDIRDLLPGLYTIKILQGELVYIKKLIKK